MRRALVAALFLSLLIAPAKARAAAFGCNATGGLMQQPTSHFYHAIYGGEATFSTDSEGLLARASYLERPEFSDNGYADRDYGWFGMVGTKVTKTPGRGLYAFIGGGRMGGYVKASSGRYNDHDEAKNSYLISGMSAAAAYGVHLGPLYLAAEHQTFIGYVDKTQTNALVAWPFNFFQIKIGLTW